LEWRGKGEESRGAEKEKERSYNLDVKVQKRGREK
jgi:hypothetical protein